MPLDQQFFSSALHAAGTLLEQYQQHAGGHAQGAGEASAAGPGGGPGPGQGGVSDNSPDGLVNSFLGDQPKQSNGLAPGGMGALMGALLGGQETTQGLGQGHGQGQGQGFQRPAQNQDTHGNTSDSLQGRFSRRDEQHESQNECGFNGLEARYSSTHGGCGNVNRHAGIQGGHDGKQGGFTSPGESGDGECGGSAGIYKNEARSAESGGGHGRHKGCYEGRHDGSHEISHEGRHGEWKSTAGARQSGFEGQHSSGPGGDVADKVQFGKHSRRNGEGGEQHSKHSGHHGEDDERHGNSACGSDRPAVGSGGEKKTHGASEGWYPTAERYGQSEGGYCGAQSDSQGRGHSATHSEGQHERHRRHERHAQHHGSGEDEGWHGFSQSASAGPASDEGRHHYQQGAFDAGHNAAPAVGGAAVGARTSAGLSGGTDADAGVDGWPDAPPSWRAALRGENVHPKADYGDNAVNSRNAEYMGWRSEARREGDQMSEAFEQSRMAYASGDGARAKELSTQGHAHQARRDALNQRAARWIFQANNQDSGSNEVDLHGLYVKEALSVTQQAVVEARRRHLDVLRVIVGQGEHSDGHVAKIQPAVEQLMQDEHLAASLDEHNRGIVLVKLQGQGGRPGQRQVQFSSSSRELSQALQDTNNCTIM